MIGNQYASLRLQRRRGLLTTLGRPLAVSGLIGMVTVSMLAGAPAIASAAPSAQAVRVANAQAHSIHAKGVYGGSGHGKAIGRSTAARTATPPVATAAEKQLQKAVAARPSFTPKQVQGTNAPASPKSAAQAAGSSAGAKPRSPRAPSDFNFFRATDVTSASNSSASGTGEPSVANDGSNVLYTGNWYAAMSADSGHSFSYVNPYTLGPAPTLPNGGFCCDQVAIHSPSANDITAWGLLYCNVTDCQNNIGDNLIRLAIARNQANLASSTFDYYDFSAQSFGFPEGDWLDYPHFGLGANSLYLSMNVFNGGTFVSDIMVRFDLGTFANGGWSANWYTNSQDFTWTPTDTSHDSFGYWAATQWGNGGLVRVYNWPEGTDWTHVGWNDFGVNFNSETKNGSCPAPDGLNWCAFDDSRVKTGGEVGTSTVYFMWDAAQGGGFAYPYTEWASFDVSTGPATSISEHQIWNGSYAWQYPGLGVDAAGNLGVSIQVGGGTFGYPGSQFLLADDLQGAWGAFALDNSSHSNSRWGDYLTARPATYPGSSGNTWIIAGYTLHDNGFGSAVPSPHFYWGGRQRDEPFAPVMFSNSGFTNAFNEGNANSVNTGYFWSPSNCACDYFATNNWGDFTSDGAGITPWFSQYFFLTGTHTYGEEGTYTTGLSVGDWWNGSASTNGTSTVNDGVLSASGTTLSGTAGSVVSGVVANFSDGDPFGTISDYWASINWGDSTTSAGSIGGGFSVSGSHTYASTGTYTVTVSIFDVGGASTTAIGTAHINAAAPTLASVSPNAGPTTGGQTVTIQGANFTGATAIKFGTTPATTFTVVNSTTITAKAPAHAVGVVDVRVTTPAGTTVIAAADHYTYVAAPHVTKVTPASGGHLGGQTVTITGTGFTGTISIKFGTSAAVTFTVVNSTTLKVKVPAHATGTVDVQVTTAGGTSAVVPGDHYKYI